MSGEMEAVENEGELTLCNAAWGAGVHVETSPLWVSLFQCWRICFVVFLQVLQPVLLRPAFLMSRIL